MLAADKVLIVGYFNIHIDNEKYALGSAFTDILNSIGVRQHISGPFSLSKSYFRFNTRVGYHLNFIDFDSDSAYQFRFFSIPSFDSNVIK